jgi:hypothetical protein
VPPPICDRALACVSALLARPREAIINDEIEFFFDIAVGTTHMSDWEYSLRAAVFLSKPANHVSASTATMVPFQERSEEATVNTPIFAPMSQTESPVCTCSIAI